MRIREWNAGNQGGKKGNKSENLGVGVELMNYSFGQGQEARNCVFLLIV